MGMTVPNQTIQLRPTTWRASGRQLVALLSALLVVCLAPFAGARAEDETRIYSSFVTPFPNGGVYQVMVIGDALADGTYVGLTRAFRGDQTLQLRNEAKYGTGFSRRIYIGRDSELTPLLEQAKPDIVVVVNGATDAVAPIMDGNQKLQFGTPRWNEVYSQRLDEFLKGLKRQHIAVYWVGLPIMQDPRVNENMNTLNDIYREKAHINGAKFIDTWNGFVDQYGNFSDYGPDLDGLTVRLRSKDGILFTPQGFDKLANYVEREIRRDLIAARSERNVPLAGDVEEQNDIMKKTAAPAETFAGMNGESQGDTAAKLTPRTTSSAAVFGELIASDRASGLTLLSSVTRINDTSLAGGMHTLPLNLRPYYRVLVKGESLQAKPGRADDFAVQAAAPVAAPTTPQ